ncbi:transposase [Pedobacter sp. L105]|uniref:IS66 family transposase n=1 Tax=Pedobacter sp. L105 TaxID=1641871 RepID=UPI00131A99AC|nr:transposase [Pedobacter sp. L105]
MSSGQLHSDNPELLIYTSGKLHITVLGGIRLTGLERLKVTLKLTLTGKREDGLSFDQIRLLRLEQAVPVLNELKAWLMENYKMVLPSSVIGKAIAYNLSLWDKLVVYVQDGRLQPDNNAVENSVRPLSLGRKNWMFAGSHEGAKTGAMLYSFMGSCKMNGINPQQWLMDILERIPAYKANKLHELLPNNWTPPQKQ